MKNYYSPGLPHDARRFLFSLVHRGKFRELQNKRKTISTTGYTYKPFDEYRCIFVHIPKTAGVSVSKALFGNLAGGHDSVGVYKMVFSKRDFDGYFKFTFVRNPWDRLLSAYNFLRRGGMNAEDKLWADRHLSPFDDFGEFVEALPDKKGLLERAHFMPQYRFLCSRRSREVPVDFVGFYENLQEDFDYVKSRLGIKPDVELPAFNTNPSSEKIDYREYYTDRTREIVGSLYRRDMELFGYDFDGSSPKNQASRPA